MHSISELHALEPAHGCAITDVLAAADASHVHSSDMQYELGLTNRAWFEVKLLEAAFALLVPEA